jgi:HEAT repeat protein
VRAAAATALGEIGDATALDALFRAFERHVAEAGMAIARLANAEAARRVLGYLGTEPFTTLRPMLLALLGRADLDRRARLDIVARVGELATAEARGMLEELVSSGDLPSTDPVYRAANETAARIAE